MTKILIIKTSSLGDIIQTFPALYDAQRALPEATFDWVVEEKLVPLLQLNSSVNQIISVAWRRWRKAILKNIIDGEFKDFYQRLTAQSYDFVIDAQGLMKSAVITKLARGLRCGYDFNSAGEILAALVYQNRYAVAKPQQAVMRARMLFSQALNYSLPETKPNFGLNHTALKNSSIEDPYIVLFHGTTWVSKQWPEEYWQQLVRLIQSSNYQVKIGWGNQDEFLRAQRLIQGLKGVDVLPNLDIPGIARVIANASGVVAVDTGFAHLADALDIPLVTIYGASDSRLTGPQSAAQTTLIANFPCAPCLKRTCQYKGPAAVKPACYATISPQRVWDALAQKLE